MYPLNTFCWNKLREVELSVKMILTKLLFEVRTCEIFTLQTSVWSGFSILSDVDWEDEVHLSCDELAELEARPPAGQNLRRSNPDFRHALSSRRWRTSPFRRRSTTAGSRCDATWRRRCLRRSRNRPEEAGFHGNDAASEFSWRDRRCCRRWLATRFHVWIWKGVTTVSRKAS